MERILSGITTTGEPQLGNLLGAIRWWVADQHRGDCFYFLADLHGLTVAGDPADRRAATVSTATLLLASGLDPDCCTLFVQSHVPAHTQLTWLLECTASMGEMRRMTQFKDKAARDGEESARVGLFTYPILMAADILLYDIDRVPVGDDQRQHLELTRRLAERFNGLYGDTFVVPEASIPPAGRGARIMDLQDPTKKMSKSTDSPQGTVRLFDTPRDIERKIKRAVTDADEGPGAVRYDPAAKPGVSNLLELLATLTDRSVEEVASGYNGYGDLKADVAAAVVAALEPLQERYGQWAADPDSVMDVLGAGAKRANQVADVTLARASDAIGLVLPR